ncbi:MAG: succinate dehydrogenase, hydrophobic membrane anchor protein [Woeseia sp.]
MSLRTPLGRVLGLGSAKEGTGHWWAQRITAAALVVLGLWFVVSVLVQEDLQFETISEWAGKPLNSILLVVTVATLAYHSKLGVQVVIEDYVHGAAIKVFSLVANYFVHVLLGAASLFAVLKIGFGAA